MSDETNPYEWHEDIEHGRRFRWRCDSELEALADAEPLGGFLLPRYYVQWWDAATGDWLPMKKRVVLPGMD